MGRLPEAWVAPPEVRELREEVRYRAKLSRLRAGLKTQVHQTLGKEGVLPEVKGIWGPAGQRWLDELRLGDAYVNRIESLRDLIELYDREIDQCDTRVHWRLRDDPRYQALQRIAGVGPVFAAIFIAEVGDISRFPDPRRLCSWAGLTPATASPTATFTVVGLPSKDRRSYGGRRSKRAPGAHVEPRLRQVKNRVGQRRGRDIGRVAAARHLLTLVYYGMRDGHIRCLATPDAA